MLVCDQHGALHAEPRVEDAADEDAHQQRDETDADVVERHLVVAEAEVLEQQPQSEIGKRVADLVNQNEQQNHQRPLARHELHERAEVSDDRFERAMRLGRLAMARRLAHHEAHQHRGQRERRTRDIGSGPADARGKHQGECTGGRCADAPAVLRHAGAGAKLARLEELDAIGVDDDVERRPGNPERDRSDCDHEQRLPGIGEAEKCDRGHHQHADQPQPAAPLAEAPDHRQPQVVDDRRPQELEVVGEESQREGRHCALADVLLGEARGEGGTDHREGEARGDAEEQGGKGRRLEVRADRFRQAAAPVALRPGSHSRS